MAPLRNLALAALLGIGGTGGLPQGNPVLQEDDACIGASCAMGLLQERSSALLRESKHASATSAKAHELEVQSVSLDLVDDLLRKMKMNASEYMQPPDAPDGCGAGFTATGDGVSDYNYERPETWEPLELCLNGPAQSPINIATKSVIKSGGKESLGTKYEKQKGLYVENTGHNLKIKGDFGKLKLPSGVKYEAVQFHVHAPSEHTIDNKSFAMELHMVHVNAEGLPEDQLAVVGIFFEIGLKRNECIEQMIRKIPRQGCKAPIPDPVDFEECFSYQLAGPWYNYRGSLTTPPCTEGVQFNLMKRTASMTLDQYTRFKLLAYGDPSNNRPVQAQNGRILYFESAGQWW